MCCCDDKKKNRCEHPERLGNRNPGDCSPEQIEECHGKDARHDCCK
jgi:hypothetical protein